MVDSGLDAEGEFRRYTRRKTICRGSTHKKLHSEFDQLALNEDDPVLFSFSNMQCACSFLLCGKYMLGAMKAFCSARELTSRSSSWETSSWSVIHCVLVLKKVMKLMRGNTCLVSGPFSNCMA
jgi:hypothetical protein